MDSWVAYEANYTQHNKTNYTEYDKIIKQVARVPKLMHKILQLLCVEMLPFGGQYSKAAPDGRNKSLGRMAGGERRREEGRRDE